VIANQYQNRDLFWALRGGGGGTYGVVTSVTIRSYPEIPVVISKLNFKTKVEDASFWDAVAEQCDALPELMDGGNAGEINLFRKPDAEAEGGPDIFSAMTWYTMGVDDMAEADKRFSSLVMLSIKLEFHMPIPLRQFPKSVPFSPPQRASNSGVSGNSTAQLLYLTTPYHPPEDAER
jgi:hypothetical protein